MGESWQENAVNYKQAVPQSVHRRMCQEGSKDGGGREKNEEVPR